MSSSSTLQPQKLNDVLRMFAQRSNRSSNKRRRVDASQDFSRLVPMLFGTQASRSETLAGEKEPAKEEPETVKSEEETNDAAADNKEESKEEKKEEGDKEEKEPVTAKTDGKEASEKAEILTTESMRLANVERYEKLLDLERNEMKAIDNTRKRIYQHQVDLWGMYTYGLKKIAGVNDLGDSPDAFLPGNA